MYDSVILIRYTICLPLYRDNDNMVKENIPIYVVTKGQRGRMRLRVFKDLRCPDKLITKRSSRIPYYDEIVALGVGKRFREIYKKKYNL